MIALNSIKTGIIGCGGIAKLHLTHMAAMENVEISALAAGNSQRLAEAGEIAPSARQYRDWKEMLAEESLDALLVCVTPDRHEGIEQAAAQKGIHLYVEKPLELEEARAQAIADAIRSAGILCSVGYQERYSPAMDAVRAALQMGKIGGIGHIIGRWIGDMPGVAWWRSKATSGGQIVEQSTHIFDALRFLFGEVSSVRCRALPGKFPASVSDVERGSCAELTFQNGMLATVLTGCYLSDSVSDVGFTVYGESGRIEYEWGRAASIIRKSGEETTAAGNTHRASLEAFFQAIDQNDPTLIRSPYDDALKSFQLTLAADRAMISEGQR